MRDEDLRYTARLLADLVEAWGWVGPMLGGRKIPSFREMGAEDVLKLGKYLGEILGERYGEKR